MKKAKTFFRTERNSPLKKKLEGWLTKKNYKIAKYESTKYDNKVDFFFVRFSTKVAKIK
jgi:hypothetical protein